MNLLKDIVGGNMQFVKNMKQPSFSERLGAGLGAAATGVAKGMIDKYQDEQQDETLSDLTGLSKEQLKKLSPEMKKSYFSSHLKEKENLAKPSYRSRLMPPNKEEAKNFGEDFANWKAAKTPGERQAVEREMGALRDLQYTPNEIRKYFGFEKNEQLMTPQGGVDVSEQNIEEDPFQPAGQPQGEIMQPQGEIMQPAGKTMQPAGKTMQPAGKTTQPKKEYKPKTIKVRPEKQKYADWQSNRTKNFEKNSPIANVANDKSKSLRSDLRDNKKLQQISNKLPSGIEKIVEVNPDTGELRPTAKLFEVAPMEAQIWEKILARNVNRAKDAVGAVVTNFELGAFMKQFPSLLNTPEARNAILKMIELDIKGEKLYFDALQKVYDEHGEYDIAPQEANKAARSMISDEMDALEDEYFALEDEAMNYVGNEQKPSGLENLSDEELMKLLQEAE